MSRFQESRQDHSEGGLCIKEIVPERVQLDKEEKVVIIFNNELPAKGPFVVDFMSRTNKAKQVSAKKLNSYTLKFKSPVFREADTVQAYVYHGIQRNLLGNHSFEFVSNNEMFYKLLHSKLDPVGFMCDALGISPASVHGLDGALARAFKENIPEGFNLLGVHVHHEMTGNATSQYPTLLHFAAAFGLGRLMRTLESCLGALEACSIKNCNGHRPYNIADEMGFSSLGDELRTFHDKGDASVYIDTSGNDDETYMPMEGTDDTPGYAEANRENPWSKPKYVNMKNQEAFCPVNVSDSCPDEIYINAFHTTSETEELYEDMKQQNHPEEDVYMIMEGKEISGECEVYYEDMTEGSYPKETRYLGKYDRPTSNQPVHPDGNFYRSASSAAEIRAKELQRQAGSPPPSGTMFEKDILRRVPSADQVQNIKRTDSISSRSSSSSNTSGISSGSGSTTEVVEPIHVTHAQLIEEMKQTNIKQLNQPAEYDDAPPPPPPRPDYDDHISHVSGRTSPPVYDDTWKDSQPASPPSLPRRKNETTGFSAVSKYGQSRHPRHKTAAVDGRDVSEARNRESQPPPLPTTPRRPSEPKVMDPKRRPPARLPEEPQAPKPVPRPRTLKRQ